MTHPSEADPDAATPQLRCLECGAQTAEPTQVCWRCGAPIGQQQPVVAGLAAGGPGDSIPTVIVVDRHEPTGQRSQLAVLFGIIAVVFIVIAIIYLAEPAKSLPSFIPGQIAGSTGHHPLRVTGSFVVGIVFAVGALFTLAYKRNRRPRSPEPRS